MASSGCAGGPAEPTVAGGCTEWSYKSFDFQSTCPFCDKHWPPLLHFTNRKPLEGMLLIPPHPWILPEGKGPGEAMTGAWLLAKQLAQKNRRRSLQRNADLVSGPARFSLSLCLSAHRENRRDSQTDKQDAKTLGVTTTDYTKSAQDQKTNLVHVLRGGIRILPVFASAQFGYVFGDCLGLQGQNPSLDFHSSLSLAETSTVDHMHQAHGRVQHTSNNSNSVARCVVSRLTLRRTKGSK